MLHLKNEAERRRAAGETTLRPWLLALAQHLGVSLATLYRCLDTGVRTRRKRSDAGVIRAAEGDMVALKHIAAFIVQHDYPADLAIRTVNTQREQDGLAPYEISTSTVNRYLDRLGVSRRDRGVDKRHHRRWEAPYAGHTSQMDSTVAATWWVDSGRTVSRETVVSDNKNKTIKGKTRVWLITVVDDHSRWTWGRFVEGNDATFWAHVLLESMRAGAFAPVDQWPAFGVPEKLYVDNDSAFKTAELTQLCDGLGIKIDRTPPATEHFSTAQAKGKVEKRGGDIMRMFEVVTKPLRAAGKLRTLEDMNAAFTQFLIHESRRERPSLNGESPITRWLATARVRELPQQELTRSLSLRRKECLVYSECVVKLKGRVQLPRRAPFTDRIGSKVLVEYYRADPSTLWVVIDGYRHEVKREEAVHDVAGDFHAPVETAPVKAKKELLAVDLKPFVESGAVVNVWTLANKKDIRTYPIRPVAAPHPLQTAAAITPDTVARIRAIQRLQEGGLFATPPTREQLAQLDTLMAGRRDVPEPELQEFTRQVRDGTPVPERILRIA